MIRGAHNAMCTHMYTCTIWSKIAQNSSFINLFVAARRCLAVDMSPRVAVKDKLCFRSLLAGKLLCSSLFTSAPAQGPGRRFSFSEYRPRIHFILRYTQWLVSFVAQLFSNLSFLKHSLYFCCIPRCYLTSPLHRTTSASAIPQLSNFSGPPS